MGRHYIYRMDVCENEYYYGAYIGQHKIGKKDPSCDGYKGSGIKWKKNILSNHIPVKKTILRICEDIYETNYWERYYIEQALQSGEYLWNVMKGGNGHEGGKLYTEEEIRLHNKERFRRWYEANKERHAEYGRQYRERNRERWYAAKKRYEESRKEFFEQYQKEYYLKNKERLNEQGRQYYQRNKERFAEYRKEYSKRYQATHVDQLAAKRRKYYQEHREERRQRARRPCCYNGKIITFNALVSKLARNNVDHPTEVAKQYLVNE